jgi:type IV secretion system protein VirB8
VNRTNEAGSPAVQAALARSINFELSVADLARRSERRAWRVASCALAMAVALLGGYFYLLPLKQKVPYLVMADAYTGTSTVARLAGNFNDNTITASEAVNRSNIAHFILARESYDYTLIRLRDWTTVYTMASPDVAAAYTRLHASSNPESPYNRYGKTHAIRVAILSIQLLGDARSSRGATVRFQRSLYDGTSAATRPLDSKIATLAFTYKPNLSMDEKDRIENPLGFQVTSYRVDNDYASSPPLQSDESGPLKGDAPRDVPATDAAVEATRSSAGAYAATAAAPAPAGTGAAPR